ncbi:hypothetical protein [Rhodoferax saidenbachensis]|uniref:Uncharacterized protein n=1 Tax=Rhodoferax saidenbachensis TaxID=1484693 RepID=A0A1P8KFF3_9BURK|nr:hypothetical protein [Rhodoferax saidenbachensis]APW44695.1 hypothetical protein RS694_05040 [Rhodoferax saidenbachensis]
MAATDTSSSFPSAPAAADGFAAQWDEWGPVAHPCRYWPCELLSAFMLQMAAQGQCVNESMMLGSRPYAVEKLTQARTLDDANLRELAVRMVAYFDDEPSHAVATLVAASLHH